MIPTTSQDPTAPPEAWPPARRIALRLLVRPLERFLAIEAASGIMLLGATLLALAWANSPWASAYEALWHTPITLGIGSFTFSEPLHFFINDGLMTIFFFVVGLEIRREIHEGELSDVRRAMLPVAAALGGMVAPALIYLTLNHAPPTRSGWGVPMATDIAFAVGVFALLGRRVPPALRVLLLALAIIDDIGAIVVIAVFYSEGVQWPGLALAASGFLFAIAMKRIGVRQPMYYLVPGVIAWIGMFRSGVHPTIAGVILGLLTPVQSWFGEKGFIESAEQALGDFRELSAREEHGHRELLEPLQRLSWAQREALPPVVALEARLHPWVAYIIMPLFAFANAGVRVDAQALAGESTRMLMAGVILGLVFGKPIGVLAASFLAVRSGLAALPRRVTWRGVLLVGGVAGIGFTMAIFVAGLAFPIESMLNAAKLAVFLASSVSAVGAMIAGRILMPAPEPEIVSEATVDECEASTED